MYIIGYVCIGAPIGAGQNHYQSLWCISLETEHIAEALHGGFGEQGEWGQKGQGAGNMGSEGPGSRKQKKGI